MKVFEDGGFVKDAAGAAELDEVVGEKSRDQFRITADGWIEEALFELPEVIGCVHTHQSAG